MHISSATQASSHADWFRESPDYAHVPRELRVSGSTGTTLIQVEQPPGFYARSGAPEFSLNLFRRGSGRSRAQFGGSHLDVDFRPDLLTLAPADAALAFDNDAPMGCTVILLAKKTVADVLGEIKSADTASLERLNERAFTDAVILSLGMRLWNEAAASDPAGALFSDHAVRVLVLALWRAAGNTAAALEATPRHPSGHVRRAIDYLSDHMADDVTMADLVAEVGLSAGHLTRAFRAATGLPPHRWHMLRRVERVCDLLLDTRLSITEISYECGFSSSQHLASVFRKQMGCTPTEYRRSRMR